MVAPADGTGHGPGWLQQSYELSLKTAASDFERDVLGRAVSTGAIAPEDYEEAVSRYLSCTKSAGLVIDTVKQLNGIYQWLPQGVTDANFQDYMDKTTRCAEGTTMAIEGLYKVQVANPEGLDAATAAAQCLVKYGVVEALYSGDDFTKDLDDNFAHAEYKVTDPNVTMCLASLGFAISGQ
ncbi:MAG: hypothetical protein LBI33_05120 [Propionibacteriaceae bacterium]|nr:hypothetical protein [Propionibacteriaceae bacterium]